MNDPILPMLRFKNSYDGSERTSGHFGFYGEVCTNGLHVSQAEINFSIKHTKNCTHLVMPRLKQLFYRFLNNEYYDITRKFNEMAEVELIDTEKFVKEILERTKLFRYECCDKNDAHSKKACEVLQIIHDEPIPKYSQQNLWLGALMRLTGISEGKRSFA
ncbi:MAG TPA: DUF932 domain-containing protein [Gillisia sp.]|nr:DUF932 domain-containing protein [Gillisia sp.]